MFDKKKRDIAIDENTEIETNKQTQPMEDWERVEVQRKGLHIITTYSIGFIFGVVGLIFVLSGGIFHNEHILVGAILALLTFTCVGLYAVYMTVRKAVLVTFDLMYGILDIITGDIRLDIQHGSKGGVWYKLYIDGLKFEITKDEFLSLSQGHSYRVYYAPHSKIFINAEPL